jgi:hypothetical protein
MHPLTSVINQKRLCRTQMTKPSASRLNLQLKLRLQRKCTREPSQTSPTVIADQTEPDCSTPRLSSKLRYLSAYKSYINTNTLQTKSDGSPQRPLGIVSLCIGLISDRCISLQSQKAFLVHFKQDSDLEEFSHYQAECSIAPIVCQLNTLTKFLSTVFLSY